MSGRRTWLQSLTNDEAALRVELLATYPYLVTLAALTKILGARRATLSSYLRRGRVRPVRRPVTRDPVRGHRPGHPVARYYDPADVAGPLRRLLATRGDDRATSLGSGAEVREAPPFWRRPVVPSRASRDRWTEEERTDLVARAGSLGQWLSPREVAAWLGVTTQTLYNWRRRFDETGDRVRYPPYHRAPDLAPSSSRDPVTGSVRPGALRSTRGRHDPVLYDRQQVLRWFR